MSFDAAPLSAQTIPIASPIGSHEKRRRWFELSLVLFLAFSGSILRAIFIFRHGPSSFTDAGSFRWVSGVLHETGILLLLGYVLWRGGRSLRDIGFRWSWKEALLGLPLFVVSYAWYALAAIGIDLVYIAIHGVRPSHPSALQIFGHMPLAALPFMLLNPFYEELVVRAYLMTEIRELSGSMTIAAVVSLLLQTSYHIYYGWAGAIALGFTFLAFVGCFAIWRRAMPIVVAHAITDLIGYFRLR